MQLKVFCCSCFFVVMLKVKHFSPDLITNAVKRDLKLCFKVSSIQSQCNVEMERLIFIKFGYDVAFISYKCFAFRILFLKDDLIERLRVRCYRFAKVSNNSCIQLFKKHYIDYQDLNYQDLSYGCVSNCCDYMHEMFHLLLV